MQMHYEIYRDTQTLWRWRLLASNSRIIADSGEGYHNREDCRSGMYQAMDTTWATPVVQPNVGLLQGIYLGQQQATNVRFEVYRDTRALWRWRLLAGNNRTIADGAESYQNRADCKHGIELVMSTDRRTPVQEPARGLLDSAMLRARQ